MKKAWTAFKIVLLVALLAAIAYSLKVRSEMNDIMQDQKASSPKP